MAATKRIAVLVTAAEKRRIAKKAKAVGLSRGEFIRQAAEALPPPEDDEVLEGLINQMAMSTARASAALDGALAFIAASSSRIARMERKAQ